MVWKWRECCHDKRLIEEDDKQSCKYFFHLFCIHFITSINCELFFIFIFFLAFAMQGVKGYDDFGTKAIKLRTA